MQEGGKEEARARLQEMRSKKPHCSGTATHTMKCQVRGKFAFLIGDARPLSTPHPTFSIPPTFQPRDPKA